MIDSQKLSYHNNCQQKEREQALKLKKVVIVGKTTRYDFERQRYQECNNEEFEKSVSFTEPTNNDSYTLSSVKYRCTKIFKYFLLLSVC